MTDRHVNAVGVLDPRLDTPTSSLPPPVQYSSRPAPPTHVSATQEPPQPYYQYATHQPRNDGAPRNDFLPNPTSHAPPEQQGSVEDPEDQNAEDAKRPRACEACRGLKVRCDQDPQQPDIPCKRCAKAGRACIVTQPSRKRQKKADNRVAELEKKLDALTAALQQQQHASAPSPFNTSRSSSTLPPIDTLTQRPSLDEGQHRSPWLPSRSESQNGSSPRFDQADYNMQPPTKRRRTEAEIHETETLDGAGVSYKDPITKYTNSEKRDEAVGSHDGWRASTCLKDYLPPGSSSPEDFVRRINYLIPPDMGATIFNRYLTKLMPHLPAVVFPAGTTAEDVWREKPILYVCILSASSAGTLHPEISRQIAKEAVGAIADSVVRNGAKSLELIQAMQVMALWYRPPEKAEQTNFYQLIHMAAVMALDIDLGKRFNPSKARRGFGGPHAKYAPGPRHRLPEDSDTLEARRAWLCCYYLCASASMVLRRPNLIRWTKYMKECIEVLESHPDAPASDALFCQHVKIQHICEDIGQQFLMDDSTANVSISDPKVSYQLNVLETDLRNWKEKIPPACRGPQLEFFEHVTSLYLHEIALHFNHNVDDFRLPFTEESLKSVTNTSETLTQPQMAALEACLKAAHGVVETMLTFDLQIVKTLPMLIFFVRCIYAIVILIKMHVAVSTPGSELGKIMKPETLRVEHYLGGLIDMFGSVAREDDGFRPHPKILRILGVLRDWFEKHKENVAMLSEGRGLPTQGFRPKPNHLHQPSTDSEGRTPLDLLSQVAATSGGGGGAMEKSPSTLDTASKETSWTFNSPYAVDLTHRPPPGHPANAFPIYQQNPTYPMNMSNGSAQVDGPPPGVDPMNPPDFGWGTGFEQAMDIALGGVDGLSGSGLDNWFLGDSVAPFGFSGDVTAQW